MFNIKSQEHFRTLWIPNTKLKGGETRYYYSHGEIKVCTVADKRIDWEHSSSLIPIRGYGETELRFANEKYLFATIQEAIAEGIKQINNELKICHYSEEYKDKLCKRKEQLFSLSSSESWS